MATKTSDISVTPVHDNWKRPKMCNKNGPNQSKTVIKWPNKNRMREREMELEVGGTDLRFRSLLDIFLKIISFVQTYHTTVVALSKSHFE